MKDFGPQVVRFALVGVFNTLVGLLSIYSLIYFYSAGPVVANGFGYLIGMCVSFYLNKYWTFGDSRALSEVAPRYLVVVCVSYVLNLLMVILVGRTLSFGSYIDQIFGVAIYTVSMFLGSRWYVFRDPIQNTPRNGA